MNEYFYCFSQTGERLQVHLVKVECYSKLFSFYLKRKELFNLRFPYF